MAFIEANSVLLWAGFRTNLPSLTVCTGDTELESGGGGGGGGGGGWRGILVATPTFGFTPQRKMWIGYLFVTALQ